MNKIVITGGSRGIGFHLAKHFLLNNCQVVITGTTELSVNKAIKKLNNDKVYGFVCDVREYKMVEGLAQFAVKKLNSIDIWINNAGVNQSSEFFTNLSPKDFTKVIDVNIKGMMHGSHVALKLFKEQGFGSLYNMEGYGSNDMMREKLVIYGTSKRSLTYFTKALAKEMKKTNINIGRLSPGMVMTDFLKNSIKEHPEDTSAKKIFNILADEPDDVTSFLVKKILKNKKNNAHIQWLSNIKIMFRFITANRFKNRFFKI